MYKLALSTVVAVMALGGSVFAGSTPQIITVGLTKSYVPVGFDDNDNIQIVVEGNFPSTCYRVGPSSFKVDPATRTIAIEQKAYRYKGICLQMYVPFTQTINLGLTAMGEYSLKDAGTSNALGKLAVAHSTTSTADEYLYAPVTDAYVVSDKETKLNTLVVSGAFGDRCTTLEEIRVNQYPDVIVVQPIIARASEESCPTEKIRFLKTYVLQGELSGLKLLHVRSLNGQAINKMVDFD